MVLGGLKVTPQGMSQLGEVTFLQAVQALINELRTDHGTNKTALDAIETLIGEMHDDHAINITWIQDIEDALTDIFDYERNRDGIYSGDPNLREATGTSTKCRSDGFNYRISGKEYYKVAADDTITLAGTITSSGNKWGAWRFEVDKLGAITATNFGATMAEASEQDALLSLSAIALGSNKAIIGYLAIQATTGDFVGGSDDPKIGDTNVNAITWYNAGGKTGLTAFDGTLAVGATPAQISIGVTTPHIHGLDVAQISAATGQTFTVNDTIAASKLAGWVICVDLAGTGFITIGSDGDPLATAQAHNDAAARNTALDNVIARLPSMFVIIGTLKVENNGSGWTANTHNLTDAGDVTTAVLVARVAAAYSASNTTALAKPADASASAVGSLGTGKPASGPGTITAPAVSLT